MCAYNCLSWWLMGAVACCNPTLVLFGFPCTYMCICVRSGPNPTLIHVLEATKRLDTDFLHPLQDMQSSALSYVAIVYPSLSLSWYQAFVLTCKYYVVDADYPNTGYLAPYKVLRYHLQNYKSWDKAQVPKKIFNHAHSSLRNIIIQRCFGVLKAHFPVLKRVHPHSLQTQVLIVVAAVTLHNYIIYEA